MEDKGYLGTSCLCKFIIFNLPLVPGRGDTFPEGILCPAVRHRRRRQSFLYLLLLNCFQLKIIIMSKWHVLQWHIMIPIKGMSYNSYTYVILIASYSMELQAFSVFPLPQTWRLLIIGRLFQYTGEYCFWNPFLSKFSSFFSPYKLSVTYRVQNYWIVITLYLSLKCSAIFVKNYSKGNCKIILVVGKLLSHITHRLL